MRARPRPALGILALILSAACVIAVLLVSGVHHEGSIDSNHRLLLGLVLPCGITLVILIAFTGYVGWGRQVFSEAPVRPRLWWLIPGLLALAIAVLLAGTDWGEWQGSTLALLLIASLLGGIAVQLLFWGLLLVALRSTLSEAWVWLCTSLAFGLFAPLIGLLEGRPIGKTLAAIALGFLLGSAFYGIRRFTGSLAVGTLIQTLFGFSLTVASGHGGTSLGRASHAVRGAGGICLIVALLLSPFLLREVIRGSNRGDAEPATA